MWQRHIDNRSIGEPQAHKATGDAINDVRFKFHGPSLIRHERCLQVLELIAISFQTEAVPQGFLERFVSLTCSVSWGWVLVRAVRGSWHWEPDTMLFKFPVVNVFELCKSQNWLLKSLIFVIRRSEGSYSLDRLLSNSGAEIQLSYIEKLT